MAATANDTPVPLYRMFNSGNGDHFYTTSATERDNAKAGGWKDEGTAARIMPSGSFEAIPFYRGWNNKDHFYTANLSEIENAVENLSYKLETHPGYLFASQIPYSVPFYRAYQSSSGDHFYTTNHDEFLNAVNHLGYKDEGVAGYVFPAQ